MSLSIDKVVWAQVHIGTLKKEAHPKTSPYRLGVTDWMVVLNPEIIAEQLDSAKKKIQDAKKAWKEILIVCEKKMYADEIADLARKYGVHYLNYKVPSGFLTNFDTFKKRVASMNKMVKFLETEAYDNLTKKEQLVYTRDLNKVKRVYQGVQNLVKKPDLLVVVDGHMMDSFLNEIQKEKAENVVITSSNFTKWWDMKSIVMANVLSYKSLDFVMRYILS